jgi:alcohol dehydrogenase
MKSTYKAMQVSRPGVLELVDRAIPTPGQGEVLLQVEACGICGADAATIEATSKNLVLPRVPGHEVVGRILAMGDGVPGIWVKGQRVGVGRLGGYCNECEQCRRGQFQLCMNQPVMGSTQDGGYAEMLLVRHTGLVSIPQELDSVEAAPLLCAGIATFNALKKSGAQAGELVAVLGIGGLGHLALQYARKMGFRLVAIGRGTDIAAEARTLGAHHYIDNRAEDAVERLKAMGGAQVILSTIDSATAASDLLSALAPTGKLIVINPGNEPWPVSGALLVGGERSVRGTLTGSPFENEKTLDFSVLADIRPYVETLPLEAAAEAYARMRTGNVKFRMVLTMP